MEDELRGLYETARTELEALTDPVALELFRVKYLGRKGAFTAILRKLGQAPPEKRPLLGKLANDLKEELSTLYADTLEHHQSGVAVGKRTAGLDLSLPGRAVPMGAFHPVTRTMEEIASIFTRMGFSVAQGPDVELDFYNFEALNIPENHPARDMHDTFYVAPGVLLRTHTSPLQIRAMEKNPPPLKVIAPGKVYRCDSDITHTPMFHQVEGFLVDRQVSFADLKGILSLFIGEMFGSDTAIRFRPSFFPFTEPSAEVDIACVICQGLGCRVCKHTGWLEILGAGLIDPAVFEKVGYDHETYSGFAFGLGVERIAMLKYGITDLRLFFDNDLRFLSQFQ